MDLGQAIKLIALRNVIRSDAHYGYRYICRWYSEKFSTPLHMVETLPISEVLLAYYECHYENLKEEERQKELEELLETEDERRDRELKENLEEVEREEFAKITEAEEERRAKKKAVVAAKKKIETVVDPRAPRPLRAAPREEPDLPIVKVPRQETLKELPPDIKIKFVELEDADEILEGLGSFAPPED